MSCSWNLISTPPVAADFVDRNNKKQIEIQRANGSRSIRSLDSSGNVPSLPNSTVAWRPVCPSFQGQAFNHDGTTVLANYDYATRSAAEGYITTFGGTRDLAVIYSAEQVGDLGTGKVAYAVVEEDPNTGEESILEVKTTEAGANGYVSVFGGTKILRVAVLEETTEPS